MNGRPVAARILSDDDCAALVTPRRIGEQALRRPAAKGGNPPDPAGRRPAV